METVLKIGVNKNAKSTTKKNKAELLGLIETAINNYGSNCDLNFIDTSLITDMSDLFCGLNFNGDISRWNVSNVKSMIGVFYGSPLMEKNIMITVKIDESDLLDLLMDRVEWLIDDVDTQGLFREYYSTMVDYMDGMELDINKIVDNDYYNNFNVYESIDEIMHEFNENKEEAQGRIVAEYKGLYLVSYCI